MNHLLDIQPMNHLFVDLQATSMAEEPIQLTQLPMIW
jgi:hypothetical protein